MRSHRLRPYPTVSNSPLMVARSFGDPSAVRDGTAAPCRGNCDRGGANLGCLESAGVLNRTDCDCSNGAIAYFRKVAARTGQTWRPAGNPRKWRPGNCVSARRRNRRRSCPSTESLFTKSGALILDGETLRFSRVVIIIPLA